MKQNQIAKLKTERNKYTNKTWNYGKTILFILSQPRLLIFLFCECSQHLRHIQLHTVIQLYTVISYIQYNI